ncbi:MAG: GNAT family N-acetyltransferase [Candidatus Thorarchaeota archaeon]|jgi:GNAT superfamily N-acetyltransferase
MTSAILFEDAKESDLAEILFLINTLNREWFSKIIPEEYYKEPFLTRNQLNEMTSSMEFYVYREDGQIVAVGSFSSRDAETAWIPIMNVHSAYQRRGIGSALMIFLEQKAKALSYSKIHLETDGDAVWALNFYRKHGYSIFKKDKIPWGYHVWLEKALS